MTGPGPPASRPSTKTTFPEVGKQAGALQASKRVRVFNAEGALIDVCDFSRLPRYLAAPNAEVKRSHSGKIVSVCLWSAGNDYDLLPRLSRQSGRPDLNQMRRREPKRYAERWRGAERPHIGKGALGRCTVDAAVQFRAQKVAT